MTRPERDLWTLFPAAALLGFAGWVALIVETDGMAAAIVFVTGFLGVTWRACRSYHRFHRKVAESAQLDQFDDLKWMSE